jgi:RNA-binding protein YlmH
MNKTELLNKLARDGEERMLLARTMDRIDQAGNRNIPAYTSFLSPHEAEAVSRLIGAAGYPRHLFYGGLEGAERRVCAFLPDWMEDGLDAFGEDGPIVALRAFWHPGDTLTHRDILGALMGMGVTREKVGDLLVGESSCDILLLREVSDFICQSMESAGRVKLRLEPIPLEAVEPPPVQVKQIRDTVATLRLDAVASSGFSISRSKAADLISAGRVNLNWQECQKADRAVEEGDVISCRGFGKCVVKEVGGRSKKGRIAVVLERYL